jgi:hypothetical protein
MSTPHFETFEEFWPFYVHEHSRSATRTLHFIGTSLAISSFLLLIITLKWWFFVLAPVLAYGCAWFSHFFIEKNRPATFTYPLYSLRADFRMYGLMWRGQMDAEVARILSLY